jgi:hypothetical protein
MPCAICGRSFLYYYNDPICPKCNNLTVLDSITAISVSKQMVDHLNKLFYDHLTQYDLQALLGNFAAHREDYCRQFFSKYSPLDLGRILNYTLLLKKSLKFGKPNGRIPKSKQEVAEIVDSFDKVAERESEHLKIKSCYARVLYLEKFDETNLTKDNLFSIFRIVESEKYKHMRSMFAKHDLFSAAEGVRKIEEYKGGKENITNSSQQKTYTAEQFVKTFYDLISTMYVALLRNKIYAECFDLRSYKEILNDPAQLMEFVNTFEYIGGDTITVSPTKEFLFRAQQFFKISEQKVIDTLIFDEHHPNNFPLFVRMRAEGLADGDVTIISHRFSYLVYTVLHAIITKNLFDSETEKRSKEFEKKKVKEEFEKQGYIYKPNIVDKRKASLEIDGIAVKGERCYVVECKGWQLPLLIDEPDKRSQVIRDVKGIIKGEKYSFKNGMFYNKKTKFARKNRICERKHT